MNALLLHITPTPQSERRLLAEQEVLLDPIRNRAVGLQINRSDDLGRRGLREGSLEFRGDKGGDKLYEYGRISKRLADYVFTLGSHREPVIPGTHNAARFRYFAGANSSYFRLSGCWRKNSHISCDASISYVVIPVNHSGSGLPPGQVCPPPLIV